jgi:multidrug efflux pump subunit AcrA (membrane-fusion protein)
MKALSNKKIIAAGFLGLFVALLIWGLAGTKKKNTSLGVVERGDLIQQVTLSGIIEPLHKALIVAPYVGYVKKVFVEVGSMVKAGDPLVTVVQSLSSFEQSFPLRSPISGKVMQIRHNEGEYVKSGEPTDFIIRVDDRSEVFVKANAAEMDRVRMTSQQEANLKPMALNQKSYKAKVVSLSLAANDKDRWDRSTVVEYPISLKVLNPDDSLQSGMSVIIDIVTFKKEKVLTVRHEYLFTEGEKNYLLLENGEKLPVKIGMANDEKVEIVEGAKEGDKIQKVDFAALMENP